MNLQLVEFEYVPKPSRKLFFSSYFLFSVTKWLCALIWNVNDSYVDNELLAQDIWQRTLACVPIVYLAHLFPDGVLPGNFQTSEDGSELINPIAQNLSETGSHFAPIYSSSVVSDPF